MGRGLKPIADQGPIGQFATRLRRRREEAADKLTFRAMAENCHFSHSVLADAAAGKALPTWPVTEAFVRACGADDDEVAAWRTDWLDTQRIVGNLRRKLGEADVVVPTRSATGHRIRQGRLRPVEPDLAEPDQCQPRPDQVRTFDDLHYQLNVLKIAVGNPGLRELRRRMRRYYGVSTLSDVFSGQRPPRFDQFMRIVTCLLDNAAEPHSDGQHEADSPPAEQWHSLRAWRQAWTNAEYNRTRPDLNRRRRYGNIYLISSDQDEGPTASVVAEMDTEVAAALLGSLPPQVSAGIISDLPNKKAQAVLKAMWNQNSKIEPTLGSDAKPNPDNGDKPTGPQNETG